ncbi:MAG: S-methyl-5'-thioadenosine phosphorylase [Dehalococcoidia bacterium]|nr:S-methyl-5'-thioadenosine phosphorylase [Dehalococcoidia bacterium]MDW8119804.1 S-methyl-5'-thioadenosine phosphorylase [Chloroflexota bacterium]
MPTAVSLAVIGGSGLYQMEGLRVLEEVKPTTPFGDPSDAILIGELEGVRVAFLPRHGRGHRLSPSALPVRANLFALKTLGVERLLSISAVGSLRENIRPLDLVVPDQVLDRTQGRPSTFFDGGPVVHIAFADPFCPVLSQVVAQGAQATGARVHRGGTYLCIEGPAFSTKAESHLYRSWGADIIGMTALPEAKLAREAEMCYAILAIVTDYDVWHPTHAQVSVEVVVQNLRKGTATAQSALRRILPAIPQERACPCASALQNAIVTDPRFIPVEVRRRLAPLIGKYLPP